MSAVARRRPNPTRSQFHGALKAHTSELRDSGMIHSEITARRAMFAAFWFIENVTDDDPARVDLFFKVRELVREARQ